MDLKCFLHLFLFIYLKNLLFYFCFNSTFENNNFILKKKYYMKTFNNYFNKLSNFQLRLIFRKQKDQSMVRSIPSHVRRRNKKKKKKKKKKDEKDEKKKVNKKLLRRRLLKFYKLKKKNEGIEDNIFSENKKYSIFDYIEQKLKCNQNYSDENNNFDNSKDKFDENENFNFFTKNKKEYNFPELENNKIEYEQKNESNLSIYEENMNRKLDRYTRDKDKISEEKIDKKKIDEEKMNETEKNKDEEKIDKKKIDEEKMNENEKSKDEEKINENEKSKDEKKDGTNSRLLIKKKKKKLKKLKKNMHIGRYRRKVYTYEKKISVDDIHDYVLNNQLKDKYILKRDSLKNVFVNTPLFNFYNFYNFFQIDHIEKYNKSKILNLIYYYIYKYKNNIKSEAKYDCLKTDEVTKKYESIADDKRKMNHYLEHYINMNNNKYLYMNIDKDYTLKKKINDSFTISNINKVDSLHIHNYKVVWTIRNVQEKLFWRFREMGNIPLTTSSFSFAGKKSFKLKIWLDGHKSAKKGYVSVGLKQLEHYDILDEYICFSLNGITKGPFTFLSKEYYQNSYNFCKFDDLDLKNDELELSLFVYDGIV
ncbi:conserved Plasmodium protein, unknown function [Plasmodium relictum]|uniref:Uncharacterized protein n=1 Tax=Plasmodium relictum TaxID=85471 RepID=A0A1J1H3D6_PLARL|nr:conserved Plasmodium protein, unknown function [Plasmodium relictum]CRG99428.1 conserved Plasmodium protein, unknown function [Plasmodium relictum]